MRKRIIDWDWLVEHVGGEFNALEILNCIEAVYIAKTIDVQTSLPHQERIDRIIWLYGESSCDDPIYERHSQDIAE